jgi:hypothetical protein
MSRFTGWGLIPMSIVGYVESVLKFLKETLTLAVNILSPILGEKYIVVLENVRGIVNAIYDKVSKFKDAFV